MVETILVEKLILLLFQLSCLSMFEYLFASSTTFLMALHSASCLGVLLSCLLVVFLSLLSTYLLFVFCYLYASSKTFLMALHLADSVKPTMSSGEQIFTKGKPDCKCKDMKIYKIMMKEMWSSSNLLGQRCSKSCFPRVGSSLKQHTHL